MRGISQAIAAASVVAVAGCATAGGGSNLALGAFASGQQGSDTAAGSALIEALNGGIVSRDPGVQLDASARRHALSAEYEALEYAPAGRSVDWTGDAGRVHGEVVASQPYRVGSQNCRQYSHTVYQTSSPPATTQGAACRNPNGSWTPLT